MRENSFEIHRHEILFENFGEPILLKPFGDVHRFAHNCAEERWLDELDWCKKQENIYYLGMGDYDDFASHSERHALRSAGLHETTIRSLDDMAEIRMKDFVDEIAFMKGRVIGLVEGNHHHSFGSGITTTQKICEAMNCRYLGISCFIRLVFKYAKGNKSRSLDIWAHHGRGASRLIGGSVNNVQRMADAAEADIYLMGHDHKKWGATMSRLKLDSGNKSVCLSRRKIILARTGSFQLGYKPGEPSYPAQMAMAPTDLGAVSIELTPKLHRKQKGTRYDGGRMKLEEEFEIDMHLRI